MVTQLNTILGELVKVRSVQPGLILRTLILVEHTDVAIAEVITEDEHDVWLVRCLN